MFQAEQHPGEGVSRTFFQTPHHTGILEGVPAEIHQSGSLFPLRSSYLYSVYTPPFSSHIVLPSSPSFLSCLYIKVAGFVLVFSYFSLPSMFFFFS